jgi:hypothetical protein
VGSAFSPAVEFDWDRLEQPATDEFEQGRQAGRNETLQMFVAILRWLDVDGRSRATGIQNLAFVLLYLFHPDYRAMRQTDLLLRFDIQSKQLLNREIRYFKRAFPGYRDSRFFTPEGCASIARSYWQRHADK